MLVKGHYLVAVLLLAAVLPAAFAAVAGIDLGSDHFKVVVVRPGSLDIALNEASGRKSAVAVGFAGDERLLGDPAASQVRFARTLSRLFLQMIGKYLERQFWASNFIFSSFAFVRPSFSSTGKPMRDPTPLLSVACPVSFPRCILGTFLEKSLLTMLCNPPQATKSPASVYSQFLGLLGRQVDTQDPWFQDMKKQQPWLEKAAADPVTKHLVIQHDESTSFSLEEGSHFFFLGTITSDNNQHISPLLTVLAQVLSYAGQIAASSAGHTIKDVAITVPNYFTQAQRVAVVDAAKLANLNVLALINQGAALALQYGIERTFEPEKPQHVIFYDMGASNLQVSLFKFTGVLDKKNKPVGGAQLLAQAWDDNLGGRSFDQKIVEHFLKEIEAKGHRLDGRGLVKLQRAVKKAKEVLSANKESHVSVESLTSDFDFRSVITRDVAEELFTPLLERAVEPLKRVLAAAQLDLSQIDAIELFGGAIRVPKLQEKLKEFLQREQLDKHLNGDEAAVFGAALHAASVSAQHRTREFRLKDAQLSHFPVLVTKEGADVEAVEESSTPQNNLGDEIDSEEGSDVGPNAQIRDLLLFKPTSRYGAKRTLEFAGYSNFSINLSYGSEGVSYVHGVDTNIASYEVSGIPQADQYNMTGRPRIQVKFALSPSGVVSLTKALANISYTIQKEVEVPKPKVEEEPKEGVSTESTESTSSDGSSDESTKQDSSTDTSAETQSPEVEKAAPEVEKVLKIFNRNLNVALTVKAVKESGLSPELLKAGRKKLDDLDEKDRIRKETAKAKNAVESFVYDTRDKIYSDEVVAMSTEAEREDVSSALSSAADWLDDEGFDATKTVYQDKLKELQTKSDKIMNRVRESSARPQAIESCLAVFNLTRTIAENITSKFEVSEEERESLVQKVDETEEWLNSSIADQEKLQPHEDPVVQSSEINKRCQDIQFRVRVLLKRPIRRPKPKPKVEKVKEEVPEPEKAEPQPESASTEETKEADPLPESEQPDEAASEKTKDEL
jgi:hypoxia up-regulated 1